MKNIDLNEIPKFVINLPHRVDRLTRFNTDFNLFFPDATYKVIPAVTGKDIKKAIAYSHQKAVTYGYTSENILIMEDDVKFTSDKAYSYAINAFQSVPDDFDILLGGIYQAINLGAVQGVWRSVDVFSALHFYVINKKAYDKFLAFTGDEHIDRWVGKNFKCYVTEKLFAVQHNGYSDQVCKETDYDYLLERFKLV